jgi:hypothetical protein
MKLAIMVPTNTRSSDGAGALLIASRGKIDVRLQDLGGDLLYMEVGSSILTFAFNLCWAQALNEYEAGRITHFLMWHSDVRPCSPRWLDTLTDEMEKAGADVLGTSIPIKDTKGLTSTAIDTDPWRPQRVSLKQMNELPPTWSCDRLLINTGLMLVDLRKPWWQEICFDIEDRIVKVNDYWRAECKPEDWQFSRAARKRGARIFVTRAVVVEHTGLISWASNQMWGWPVDSPNESVLSDASDLVITPKGEMQSVRFGK